MSDWLERRAAELGMKAYELPTNTGTLKFYGRLIDLVDNDRGDRPRWAELRLYKTLDSNPAHDDSLPPDNEYRGMYGQEMWLLYTIGHTLVYHRDDGCGKGVQMTPVDIPNQAEDHTQLVRCRDCRPRDWRNAAENDLFDVEITWYSYVPCPTPQKVIRSLHRDVRCKNCRHKPHETWTCKCRCRKFEETPAQLSMPGSKLVGKVKLRDPEIAAAAVEEIRL